LVSLWCNNGIFFGDDAENFRSNKNNELLQKLQIAQAVEWLVT